MLDLSSQIMDYENGQLDEDQVIALFQDLIDTGLAWKLQGRYGRAAVSLIKSGECVHARRDHDREGIPKELNP